MIESEYFLLTIFSLDRNRSLTINCQDTLHLYRLIKSLILLNERSYSNSDYKLLFLFLLKMI